MMPNAVPALIAAVADAYDLPVEALESPSRARYVTQARQAAMWLLRRRYAGLSLVAIGAQFGRSDHTTVRWALDQVEQRRRDDPAFAARLDALLALTTSAPAAD